MPEIEEIMGLSQSERKMTKQPTRRGSNDIAIPSFSGEEFRADSDLLSSALYDNHFKSGSDLMLLDDGQNSYDEKLLDMLDLDPPEPKYQFSSNNKSRNERLPAFGNIDGLHEQAAEDLNFFSQSTFGRV